MKLINKMTEGKKYTITIMEEGELTGIYKGWADDSEGEFADYVVFWEEGKNRGTMVCCYEIETVKAVR
jgi:hypothetical protein